MSIADLWLPILASAVIVFVFSALVWMVFPWHKTDFRKFADEDRARNGLQGSEPGYYMVPYCTDPKELEDPEKKQKYIDGPVGFVTIAPSGVPTMGGKLVQSFLYYVVVGIVCAYMVSRTVASGADYLSVFRIAGTTAFLAYGVAYVQDSVWFSRPWSLTAKNLFDALLYGLLTGGVFGWLA